MNDKLLRKIVKKCGTPERFCFDYVIAASVKSGIRRMKEYVKCVRSIERKEKA